MLNLQLAKKYSRAIFEIAQEENKLEEYGRDLAALKSDVFGNEDLKAFLTNPRIPRAAKRDLAQKLFGGEVSHVVNNFLLLLIDKQREILLGAIEEQYKELANQAQGIVVADVITAQPLSDEYAQKLQTKMQDVTGKKITLRQHLDADIIGGIVVKIGDRRIDGSIAGRMEKLKAQLLARK